MTGRDRMGQSNYNKYLKFTSWLTGVPLGPVSLESCKLSGPEKAISTAIDLF